jgi:uncharacterized membrane protein
VTRGLGRRVYGGGAILLGVVQWAYGSFAEVWLPVPADLPGYAVLAYASGGVLILGGLAVNISRAAAAAALALAAFFAAWMFVLYGPLAIAKPGNWGVWQAIAESTVMAAGGVLAWTHGPAAGETRAAAVSRAARLVFGLCLLVFGVSHFVYAKFTAAMVPAWLPPSQLVWAYLTGVAQIAAGLAMLSGVRARLAAILLSVMYAAFSLLVHIPSVIAHPSSQGDWAENGINLILLGAAWTLADSLAKPKTGG